MQINKSSTSTSAVKQPVVLFNPRCFLNQVNSLHQQFGTALYASYVAALLITCIILKIVPGNSSIDWLMLFSVITGLRVYFGLIRYNNDLTIQNASEWYGTFLIGCFISGSMWCYMGLVLIPGLALPHTEIVVMHAITILFLTGLTAGANASYQASLLAFFAFTLPAVVPYAIYLSLQQDRYMSILGTLFLIYYLFILMLGLSNRKKIVQAINTTSSQ